MFVGGDTGTAPIRSPLRRGVPEARIHFDTFTTTTTAEAEETSPT
jgi:hypothetical protein